MKTEYEVRVLEINKEEMIKKLEELGATKKGDFNQKRYVYDLKPIQKGKWIRLRTNGKVSTLTYKDIVSNTIDGTKEVEFEVEDFEKANEFLEKIGFTSRSYQENDRSSYILNGVEIDIDSWHTQETKKKQRNLRTKFRQHSRVWTSIWIRFL